MARTPRIVVPGQPLHIVQRGNNRQATFFTDDDYWKYLHDLKVAADNSGCSIHAYVLMTNHVHLLVTPPAKDSAARLMQDVGRRYVRYINGVYGRSGTLWEGRFKSSLIDTEAYFLICSRYIEMNPVRANVTDSPAAYPWSSYHHNALGKTNSMICEHEIYSRGGSSPALRRENYKALFSAALSEKQVTSIRDGLNRHGLVGGEKFKQEIEKMLGRRLTIADHGGARARKTSSVLTP